MHKDEIAAKARKAFAQRDELLASLRDNDNELRALRAAYMREARVWGIGLEAFRHEVHTTEVMA